MDIGEFDLMRNFINEKGLLNQYQEWRKSYIKDYENVIVNFHCLNKKYEFQITIARKQLKTFVEWSEFINPEYQFKASLERHFKDGKVTYERNSDVFLTGSDVKSIFWAIDHSKGNDGSLEIANDCSVDWKWTESDWGVINEFDEVSGSLDDDSATCGSYFVGECQDWDYDNNGDEDDGYSWRWNIEDK